MCFRLFSKQGPLNCSISFCLSLFFRLHARASNRSRGDFSRLRRLKSTRAVSMSLLMNRARRHAGATGPRLEKQGPQRARGPKGTRLEIWIGTDWAKHALAQRSPNSRHSRPKNSARWIGVPGTCFDSRCAPRSATPKNSGPRKELTCAAGGIDRDRRSIIRPLASPPFPSTYREIQVPATLPVRTDPRSWMWAICSWDQRLRRRITLAIHHVISNMRRNKRDVIRFTSRTYNDSHIIL